ncbi:uncharacterized protein LOC114961764 isoform X3 [Acropora millepora]|nr:uncharacterized protein LOC114961764 isoform X3 [Acropora millepora]
MLYFSLLHVLTVIALLAWIKAKGTGSAEVGYKKLGCYNDNDERFERPLSDLLFTDLDMSSSVFSGTQFTRDSMDSLYLSDLVERCALKTKEFGFAVFGIERVAECWSGDDAWLTYNKDGPSKKCLNAMFTPCDENCEEEACFGNDDAVFVYGIGQPNKTSTPCHPTPPVTKPTQVTVPTARTGATNLPTTRMIHATTKTSGTLNIISTTTMATTRKRPLFSTSRPMVTTRSVSRSTVALSHFTNPTAYTSTITGSTLNCPSECEVSCIGPCVPDCCVAAPQYSGIYSSIPMQPASTGYQCHFPCPNACAPACSTKCCQAFYRVSTLFFRRKRAWGRMRKQSLQKYLYRILRTQMRHRRRNKNFGNRTN